MYRTKYGQLSVVFVTAIFTAGSFALLPAKSAEQIAAAQAGTSNRLAGRVSSNKHRVLRGRVDRQVLFADQLMSKGKYAEAADQYKEALSRNRNNALARVGLGLSYAKQFKLNPASEQLR